MPLTQAVDPELRIAVPLDLIEHAHPNQEHGAIYLEQHLGVYVVGSDGLLAAIHFRPVDGENIIDLTIRQNGAEQR